MTADAAEPSPAERVDMRRLLLAGLAAAVTAAIANEIIRAAAVALIDDAEGFEPFGLGRPALFTVIGVGLGTALLAVLARRSQRPLHTFRIVAWILVAVSLIPDILLLVAEPVEGVTASKVAVLVLMHLVAAAIAIPILTTWPRARDEAAPAA